MSIVSKIFSSLFFLVTLLIGFSAHAQDKVKMDTENLNQLKAGKEKSQTRDEIKRNEEKNRKAYAKRQSKSARKMMKRDAKKSKRINDGKPPETKLEHFFKKFKKGRAKKGGGGRK